MKFSELFDKYYERHAKKRTKRPENAYYFYTAHGPFWADREVAEISRLEVQEWSEDLAEASPSSATRALNMLSIVINWGIKRGYISCVNPCVGVDRFTVQARDRFLLPSEIERLKLALQAKPDFRDFIFMLLLTGARRGNVQSMRWDEIDLDLAIWRHDSKNGDIQIKPLSEEAQAILARRIREVPGEWVFPGRYGGHMKEPKRIWRTILNKAKISNLRLHDLRRTLGSYMAIGGAELPVIGKALGHRDVRSTMIYARLNLEPVRKELESVHSRWKLSA